VTGVDDVRARFEAAEDVDLPDGMEPVGDGPPGGAPPTPDPADGPPPESEAARFPLNDTGNGRRFQLYFGYRPPVDSADPQERQEAQGEAIHVPRVGWHAWNGTAWEKDPDELAARRLAHRLSERMKAEARHLKMPKADHELVARADEVATTVARIEQTAADRRTEADRIELAAARGEALAIASAQARLATRVSRHLQFANTTGNIGRVEAALKVASVYLARQLDQLDADPLVVNCRSGTLRFRVDRTGAEPVTYVRQSPHARQDMLTKTAGARLPLGDAWVPRLDMPVPARFAAFLARILPDAGIRAFVQRWFGLSLTGLINEQKLLFLHGDGSNGKSVLVETLARILADYSATAKIESLTGRNRRGGGDPTPDLIPLIGARMVRASEPEEGERLQEGKVKELTGGEPILVRALHEDFVEVTPRFKLTISGNHKPEIRGGDEGIWRRVLLVPFEVTIPKAERRPFVEMVEDLLEERDAIFAWMVDGLMEYLAFGLQEPPAVLDATREYREESDPTGQFLSRACLVTGDPADSMTSRELNEAMAYWQSEQGAGVWTPRTIAIRLKDKCGTWRDPRTGRAFAERKASIIRYDGIRLLDDFRARLAAAPRGRDGRPYAGERDKGEPAW
jgi:putative DNA primase/helicase